MFGNSGAHEMGYANAAVFIALVRKLIDNGTITRGQAIEVLDDAKSILEPYRHVATITSAINMIQTDVKTRLSG
jgi:hypothetical protein